MMAPRYEPAAREELLLRKMAVPNRVLWSLHVLDRIKARFSHPELPSLAISASFDRRELRSQSAFWPARYSARRIRVFRDGPKWRGLVDSIATDNSGPWCLGNRPASPGPELLRLHRHCWPECNVRPQGRAATCRWFEPGRRGCWFGLTDICRSDSDGEVIRRTRHDQEREFCLRCRTHDREI